MKSFKQMLEDYADLIVEVGINVQKDQPILINASIEGADFIRLLVKKLYERGAGEVVVSWSDDYLTRLNYEMAYDRFFQVFPQWLVDRNKDLLDRGAGVISVSSKDPELLKGIDPLKLSQFSQISSKANKENMKYTMNDINPWCVLSIPGAGWAKKVFPQLEEDEAINKLWEKIFYANRVNLEDPVQAWKDHINNIQEKVKFLNESNFDKLLYKSSNGTDLEVKLPKNHIWAGGNAVDSKGTLFTPNMPTEEVYTMPDKYGVNGIVYSSMPLNLSGSLVEDFYFRFEDGKIVDLGAKSNKEVLENEINIDDGARYLGEVALVAYDSPISNLNLIFYNTLYDENASCHFAFGAAYPTNIKNGENMTSQALEENHVNQSATHVDFMVGTNDLSIIGVKENGQKVQIFKNGNWA